MFFPVFFLVILAQSATVRAQSQVAGWLWNESNAALLITHHVRPVSDVGLELDLLPSDKNVALGEVARNDFGQRVPLTDGEISLVASEWISNTPNVFGRYFTIDLGRNRAITRIRMRPGQTALNQPEYYVRGYRVEAAMANEVDIWRLLAEERNNFNLLIDTQLDSTWRVMNKDGPVSRVGQHVRFTITRQDRSNWVALGDIEVFAEGFEHEGSAILKWSFEEPINVGRIRWQTRVFDQTVFRLFAKDRNDARDWNTVYPMDQNGLFTGSEPAMSLEVLGELTTADPFASPRWRQLEVEYDRTLVAASANGSVLPRRVDKGKSSEMTYSIELEVNDANYGVDKILLDGAAVNVDHILIDGVTLESGNDFSFYANDEDAQTEIRLKSVNRVDRDAIVQIVGQVLFLNESYTITFRVGNTVQETSDGYLNWQNGREKSPGSWTVKTEGQPGQLLSSVEVSQRPFSPYEKDALEFRFVVSNLNNPTDVVLSLYDLNGNRVRSVSQTGSARQYTIRWDGKSEGGLTVDPGLYLYEVEVRGSGDKGRRQGTCVVAY